MIECFFLIEKYLETFGSETMEVVTRTEFSILKKKMFQLKLLWPLIGQRPWHQSEAGLLKLFLFEIKEKEKHFAL